jgi:hypothetical protein
MPVMLSKSRCFRPKSATHFTERQTVFQLVWKEAAVSFQLTPAHRPDENGD